MSATSETDARSAIDEEHERLRSLGDLADSADQPEDDDGQQQLLDFGGDLNLKLGGMKPTDSEIKIKAISMPIHGQLGDTGDDETVTLLVTARGAGVETVNKRDGGGKMVGKTRRHKFEPISVLPLSAEQADKALGIE